MTQITERPAQESCGSQEAASQTMDGDVRVKNWTLLAGGRVTVTEVWRAVQASKQASSGSAAAQAREVENGQGPWVTNGSGKVVVGERKRRCSQQATYLAD